MTKPLEPAYVTIDRAELRRLQQLDQLCEGLTQDHIDGGWTAKGLSAHCAKAEIALANAAAHNRKLEGLLLWTLYHHQGGKSNIGQPIRAALGIGEHDHLTPVQIDQAHAAVCKGGCQTMLGYLSNGHIQCADCGRGPGGAA